MRLVTRPEIEDPAAAAFVAAAAPEHLPAREPADQHEAVRSRDVEMLAVHLLGVEREAFSESLRDRMRRVDDPHPLVVAALAPVQVAGRSHEPLEDLRMMRRVQDDETHTVEDAAMDALDDRVVHLAMRGMAPPGEHVRLREYVFAESVLGLVERRRPHVEPGVAQALRDDGVDAVGVDLCDRRVASLLAVLRPDRDPRHDAACVSEFAAPTAPARPVEIGTALPSVTTAPPFWADKRIASQSRAIRSPTSAGFGFGAPPARTWLKRSHTDAGPSDETRRKRRRPARWSSSRSP